MIRSMGRSRKIIQIGNPAVDGVESCITMAYGDVTPVKGRVYRLHLPDEPYLLLYVHWRGWLTLTTRQGEPDFHLIHAPCFDLRKKGKAWVSFTQIRWPAEQSIRERLGEIEVESEREMAFALLKLTERRYPKTMPKSKFSIAGGQMVIPKVQINDGGVDLWRVFAAAKWHSWEAAGASWDERASEICEAGLDRAMTANRLQKECRRMRQE